MNNDTVHACCRTRHIRSTRVVVCTFARAIAVITEYTVTRPLDFQLIAVIEYTVTRPLDFQLITVLSITRCRLSADTP